MTTQLLEDRPETVWELLTEGGAVPRWLTGLPAYVSPGVGTPTWPEPGARLDYRAGRGRRQRVVTVGVLAHDHRRRLTLLTTRPLLGSTFLGNAVHGAVLIDIHLEDAPVFRTAVRVDSRRYDARRRLCGRPRQVSHRAARRMVADLVSELRRRDTVMAVPRGQQHVTSPTRR